MNVEKSLPVGESSSVNTAVTEGTTIVIRVEANDRLRNQWIRRLGLLLLLFSLLFNAWFMFDPLGYAAPPIPEQHFAGEEHAELRIAIINFEGTISPPFTERWVRQIRRATEDNTVKGVVMAIDSPGGFVADSHQLLREIQKMAQKKPVFVAMKRIAASGGYYIAMGIGEQGRIFAEPTTWTGSIGVIIPRYNATQLVEKIGLKSEPLVTGPLKDTLNPFRDMRPDESDVWDAILKDSFDRFVAVIDAGRSSLDDAAIRRLATGQVYTANQAMENHLVDEIGYVEDACQALAGQLQLTHWEAFEYRSTPGLVDVIMGYQTRASGIDAVTEQILQSNVPQAMYYTSSNSWLPGVSYRN